MIKLIFIVFFCSLFMISSHSENISDLQIEGMSAGDNLLDYFSKKNIDNNSNLNKDFQPKNKNYKSVEFFAKEFRNKIKFNESVAITLNKDNYTIEEIISSDYNKDLTKCKKKYMEMYNDVNLLLKDVLKVDRFKKEFNQASLMITVWDYDSNKKDWEKYTGDPKMFEKTNLLENSIQLGLIHYKLPEQIKAKPSAYCQTGFQLTRKHIR
jgi:hypothetical protein